jgi:multidrug transporter EmrE-like cation transporter
VLSAVMLGERLSAARIGGMALVVAGVVMLTVA